MSTVPPDVGKTADVLTEACFRANDNVRVLRNVIRQMQGDPKDTALGLMQYLCIFANVAGLDKDEFYLTMAHAVERAWSLEPPGVCETYDKPEGEKLWN